MRRRKRKGRQMTALEATQRAAMFMIESMSTGTAPKTTRRNRGAARRAKTLAREDRLYAEKYGEDAAWARALARAHERVVKEGERKGPAT